jgi:hypothetical protein
MENAAMTTMLELRAEIEWRLESARPQVAMREALPFHDPLQLSAEVRSGDTSPLDDAVRRYRLHGLGVSSVF